ncbi:MAG: hypothetical protein R3B51_01275 [Thermodesulfobacteriota bacterium]
MKGKTAGPYHCKIRTARRTPGNRITIAHETRSGYRSKAELLIRSRYSLIFLEADEEERAETVLRLLAARLGVPYFFWTRTKGLMRGDVESKGAVYGSADPAKALMHVEASGFPALYHFSGLDGLKDDKTAAELLKNASGRYNNDGRWSYPAIRATSPKASRSFLRQYSDSPLPGGRIQRTPR